MSMRHVKQQLSALERSQGDSGKQDAKAAALKAKAKIQKKKERKLAKNKSIIEVPDKDHNSEEAIKKRNLAYFQRTIAAPKGSEFLLKVTFFIKGMDALISC